MRYIPKINDNSPLFFLNEEINIEKIKKSTRGANFTSKEDKLFVSTRLNCS